MRILDPEDIPLDDPEDEESLPPPDDYLGDPDDLDDFDWEEGEFGQLDDDDIFASYGEDLGTIVFPS